MEKVQHNKPNQINIYELDAERIVLAKASMRRLWHVAQMQVNLLVMLQSSTACHCLQCKRFCALRRGATEAMS